MQVLSVVTIQPDIDIQPAGTPERTGGLHVSTILKDMLVSMDRKRFGGPLNPVLIHAGWALEHAISRGLLSLYKYDGPGHFYHPGEFIIDGVKLSPDLITIEDMLRCEEIKFTRYSCRQPITDPKFWHYIVQLKAYCRALGTNEGRLRILFINGNYSYDDNDPESSPQYKVITLRFTDLELEENWSMLINHAVRRGWLVPVSHLIH
jgi:hypothetical protein